MMLKTQFKRLPLIGALVSVACTAALMLVAAPTAVAQAKAETNPLADLEMRLIGPAFISGRVTKIAVYPDGPHHYLVATASGGLWRTENAGTTWTPLFDDQTTFSIGTVEIAPTDPLTIWVGSGENNVQRSVAYGDGVYKSTDGGKTWTNMGLENSQHISQIWIHPSDKNTVIVASQGPLWNTGGDRGLFKTTDGGETWETLLEIDEFTGINEFVVDPRDHNKIVASSYQRHRRTWTLINGGPGSGIHRTTDGGKTWTEITSGLPKDDMGRIGLAGAPSDPDMIYAIIESNPKEQGTFRSTDFGQTWVKRSDYMSANAQYYNELIVDPKNSERVYSVDMFSQVSEDGGLSFHELGSTNRHVDDHEVWINPKNTDHIMIGGDDGLYESYDQGKTFRWIDNLPLAQFYRIQPDNAEPFYNVCGGTQDNNSVCGPSRTTSHHGILNRDWEIVLVGDGYKPQFDPTDNDTVYAQLQYGGLVRYDRRTKERLHITPQPERGEARLNWNWNVPLLISPHSPTTLYYAAKRVYQSDDRGDSWRPISPDLTRDIDRNTLKVAGRVWSVDAVAKNISTSHYGAIVSFSESPLEAGLLFAGTDDGVIAVSTNGGESWTSSTEFRGIPDMALVEDIVTSVHDANVAYAIFDNHKSGDFKPYVMKTTNKGRTWRSIAGNLPGKGTAHTIAEDHVDPNLLFVGTDFGLFMTQDGGQTWSQMTGNMPTITVRDLEIQRRENDLVVGTFGRGIYILDDYSPLRTKTADLDAATLFKPRDTWMYIESTPLGAGGQKGMFGTGLYSADNPPYGAVFTYYLKDDFKSRAEIRRAEERTLEATRADTPYPSWEALRAEDAEVAPTLFLTVRDWDGKTVRRVPANTSAGLHRTAWDLRFDRPEPASPSDYRTHLTWYTAAPTGHLALPGTYSVTLELVKDGTLKALTEPQSFTVKSLDNTPEIAEDRGAVLAFQQETSDLIRASMGAKQSLLGMEKSLDLIQLALDATPGSDQSMRDRLTDLRTRTDAVRIILLGDRTLESRIKRAPLPIENRLLHLRMSWYSQSDVPGDHKKSLEIAKTEFTEVLADLKALKIDMQSLQDDLGALGGAWSPGSLPVWPRSE